MKVISGGQTGVDRAGLDAALEAGIETGGLMPKGWKALDGIHPEFAEKYGMTEDTAVGYASRTKKNVANSDGTIIIAEDLSSPGTKLTIKSANRSRKCLYVCDADTSPMQLVEWIIDEGIETVNIAGHSEENWPGIYNRAYGLLVDTFKKWHHWHHSNAIKQAEVAKIKAIQSLNREVRSNQH